MARSTLPALRRRATVVAAAAQVLLPTLLARRVAEAAAPVVPDTRVMPAPATFAVWAPVFGLSLGYAGWQARGDRPLAARLGWAPAVAFASTGAWAPLVATRRFGAAQIALSGIAAAAGTAWSRTNAVERATGLTPGERLLVAAPMGLLTGWGAAATGVNAVAMLKSRGTAADGAAEAVVAVSTVGLLGALAALAVRRAGPTTVTAQALGGTVLWSLGGIAAGQQSRSTVSALAALAAAAPVAGALIRRPRH